MKKGFLIILIVSLATLIYAEKWTTVKEKKSMWQYVTYAESDTDLCTVATCTTYIDGIVIFYCHAGKREKDILLDIYSNAEKYIESNPHDSIIEYSSNYVSNLRNQGKIKAIDFKTDPVEYTSNGVQCVKTHLYLSSWIDKVAEEYLDNLLKK